jgi:AcrR family transcriptional regulator
MGVPVTAKGQETRARLLAAAEKVFGEKSYYRVSIADITREAGTGSGTFYIYFRSKEAAFRELVRERGHELRKVTRMASSGASNRIEAERGAFAGFFDFISEHGNLYRVVRQSEFVDESLLREFYEAMAEGYAAALQSSMDAGEIRQMDPEVLAYCLMGIGDFIGMRWVVWPGKKVPPDVFDEVMEFMTRALQKPATSESKGGGPAVEVKIPPADRDFVSSK